MLPILSQQYRPKDFVYWEASNSGSFRASWTAAIDGGADWVQIVTWSDFSESGEIEPFTDSTLSATIGTGFYDANAYYSSWFMAGQAPKIDHDVLYYFYRREPVAAAAPAQSQATTVTGGTPGSDDIELLAFLATPGTISITLNGQTQTMNAPAGISSLTMPLQAGTPSFQLTRGAATVITMQGGITSYGTAGLPSGTLDLTYWSGSASATGVCSLQVPSP
jgi:hypothetical protein